MRKRMTILWIVFVLAAGLGMTSCRALRLKLGIGYTVENPEPGTPEAEMQKVLRALTVKDAKRSWKRFLPLLHSHERNSGFINTWKTMKFRHMRKVARYFLIDPAKYSFKVKRIKQGLGGTVVLYLNNPNADMPTPCKFKRDPKHGNAWRVFSSCL